MEHPAQLELDEKRGLERDREKKMVTPIFETFSAKLLTNNTEF